MNTVPITSLPKPFVLEGHYRDHTDKVDGYTAEQMREYGNQCVAASLKSRADSVDLLVKALEKIKVAASNEFVDQDMIYETAKSALSHVASVSVEQPPIAEVSK